MAEPNAYLPASVRALFKGRLPVLPLDPPGLDYSSRPVTMRVTIGEASLTLDVHPAMVGDHLRTGFSIVGGGT